jgi:hypothetical protein
MANHPNRASKTFYSTRLRAERAAGRKLVELLEVGTAMEFLDLLDTATAFNAMALETMYPGCSFSCGVELRHQVLGKGYKLDQCCNVVPE